MKRRPSILGITISSDILMYSIVDITDISFSFMYADKVSLEPYHLIDGIIFNTTKFIESLKKKATALRSRFSHVLLSITASEEKIIISDQLEQEKKLYTTYIIDTISLPSNYVYFCKIKRENLWQYQLLCIASKLPCIGITTPLSAFLQIASHGANNSDTISHQPSLSNLKEKLKTKMHTLSINNRPHLLNEEEIGIACGLSIIGHKLHGFY